jgi:hypothetical protein
LFAIKRAGSCEPAWCGLGRTGEPESHVERVRRRQRRRGAGIKTEDLVDENRSNNGQGVPKAVGLNVRLIPGQFRFESRIDLPGFAAGWQAPIMGETGQVLGQANLSSDFALKEFVRDSCSTLHHPVGTVRWGRESVLPRARSRTASRNRCVGDAQYRARQHQLDLHHDW